MFRRVRDALARVLGRPRSSSPAVNDLGLAGEVRPPDSYVWQLPDPRDARWRRWAKRSRATGHRLPFPRDEECWHIRTHPGTPLWEATDDVVRLYVPKGAGTSVRNQRQRISYTG
ncbi:hypothetical protein [Streptomyces bluensis]|uniref:hypothetical protein n=1 Tax=Streptomyces bluensis TaxID=33897 RepID=UPI0033332E93